MEMLLFSASQVARITGSLKPFFAYYNHLKFSGEGSSYEKEVQRRTVHYAQKHGAILTGV
jgi:hypothetical protein